MKITLNRDYYKGSDGSSLSDSRCEQLVLVYDMLKTLPQDVVTYRQIQDSAVATLLFGNSQADAVIRTFFPLLRKLGFAHYDGQVKTCDVFTNTGRQLILLYKAMTDARTLNRQDILNRLYDVKAKIIQLGIMSWHSTDSEKDNNIWISLYLFSKLDTVDWDEFLYGVYLWHNGESNIINEITSNRRLGVDYTFFKEDGKPLPDTTYTYIRALLQEAHLINNISSRTSVITREGSDFISSIL